MARYSPLNVGNRPWQSMSELNVGDQLVTPRGVATITDLDWPAEQIHTTLGVYDLEEYYRLPQPDMADIEAVEAWLDLAGQIIPKINAKTVTYACNCGCHMCYRNETSAPNGAMLNVQHMKQGPACRCAIKRCSCV